MPSFVLNGTLSPSLSHTHITTCSSLSVDKASLRTRPRRREQERRPLRRGRRRRRQIRRRRQRRWRQRLFLSGLLPPPLRGQPGAQPLYQRQRCPPSSPLQRREGERAQHSRAEPRSAGSHRRMEHCRRRRPLDPLPAAAPPGRPAPSTPPSPSTRRPAPPRKQRKQTRSPSASSASGPLAASWPRGWSGPATQSPRRAARTTAARPRRSASSSSRTPTISARGTPTWWCWRRRSCPQVREEGAKREREREEKKSEEGAFFLLPGRGLFLEAEVSLPRLSANEGLKPLRKNRRRPPLPARPAPQALHALRRRPQRQRVPEARHARGAPPRL